jgi:hypothetical protein
MARRPRPPDEILTREELEDLQRRLSMMSITAVQDFYQYPHSAWPHLSRSFPDCESDSGVSTGVETDAQVAVVKNNASRIELFLAI